MQVVSHLARYPVTSMLGEVETSGPGFVENGWAGAEISVGETVLRVGDAG